jgi:hypothetical protein
MLTRQGFIETLSCGDSTADARHGCRQRQQKKMLDNPAPGQKF